MPESVGSEMQIDAYDRAWQQEVLDRASRAQWDHEDYLLSVTARKRRLAVAAAAERPVGADAALAAAHDLQARPKAVPAHPPTESLLPADAPIPKSLSSNDRATLVRERAGLGDETPQTTQAVNKRLKWLVEIALHGPARINRPVRTAEMVEAILLLIVYGRLGEFLPNYPE